MNKQQRISAAKYLYDISKGVVILAVIGNIVQGKFDILSLSLGTIATVIIFMFAYKLEGGIKNE